MSKLIAFYGNSLLEKENSYSSFLAAANRNFYGILASVRFTKDHIPITSKKAHLVINGKRYYINQYTFEELKELGVFNFPHDVSTIFEVYLSICKKYQKWAFIEINNTTKEDDLEILYNMLEENEMLDQCKIVSRYFDKLIFFRKKSLKIGLQLIISNYADSYFFDACKYHLDLMLPFTKVSNDIVVFFHDNRINCGAYTISNPIIISLYEDTRVDYIYITNL